MDARTAGRTFDRVLRVVRAAMAVAIAAALAVQFDKSIDIPGFDVVDFFSYFTVLSNVFAMVLLASAAIRPALMRQRGFIAVRGAVTLYMTVTGIVYAVLLAPASADVGLTEPWVDLVVHVVGPIVVLLDWIIDPPPSQPSTRALSGWLVFPVVYFAYSLVRGSIIDWYPYPFLNPDPGGYLRVALFSVVIAAVFVLISAALRWWAGRRLTSP